MMCCAACSASDPSSSAASDVPASEDLPPGPKSLDGLLSWATQYVQACDRAGLISNVCANLHHGVAALQPAAHGVTAPGAAVAGFPWGKHASKVRYLYSTACSVLRTHARYSTASQVYTVPVLYSTCTVHTCTLYILSHCNTIYRYSTVWIYRACICTVPELCKFGCKNVSVSVDVDM